MEPHKIANILFYMSLDMDYADALESANEEIDCIARDLEFLKQNGRDVILQALEMIAMENESIPEKWNNKGYKRTLLEGNNMDTQKIAKILFYMSLDMDYADSLEYKDEEVKCITEELEILKQNECFSTLQMLEMIALKNEDMEHWKEGK